MVETTFLQTRPPRNLMLALSLAQGVALFLLWRALTNGTWPSQQPAVNFPFWTFVLVWPTLLLLSLESGSAVRALHRVSLFSGVLVLLAIHTGWQASPIGEFPIGSLGFVYAVTLLIACFKALMYLQPLAARTPVTYQALFTYSWRNFLVTALSGGMAGGVGLILLLWGELFSMIGIEFFAELFAEDWFLFPVLTVAFGLGVFIFRRLAGMIDGITGLLEGLMRLLLPLIVSVAVIFLAALPFTGLQPLWETGNGTAALICLNAFSLLFINAAYQTGGGAPYPPTVHRLLYAGIALLPIISALALYGLYLRVAQYGWTVERCWALVACLLLALFSTGYAAGILRHRADWPYSLAQVNRFTGWAVAALMLLANSPLLDFRSISLASQLGRVEAGEIELRDFDFYYARQHLARPAYLKMKALAEEFEDADPELVRLIREPVPQWGRRAGESSVWERIAYRPERFDVPESLRPMIEQSPEVSFPNPVLFTVDLNGDGESEYALIAAPNDLEVWSTGFGFYREGGEWRRLRLDLRELPPGTDVMQTLNSGRIETAAPEFQDLKVGELVFQVQDFGVGP